MFEKIKKYIIRSVYIFIFSELFLPCSFDKNVKVTPVYSMVEMSDHYETIVMLAQNNTVPYLILVASLLVESFNYVFKLNQRVGTILIDYTNIKNKFMLNTKVYVTKLNYFKSWVENRFKWLWSNVNTSVSYFEPYYQRLSLASKRGSYLMQNIASSAKYNVKNFVRKLWK